MRLSADAKAYAAAINLEQFSSIPKDSMIEESVRHLLSEAFQHGFDHAKASQRRLEKLAKGKT